MYSKLQRLGTVAAIGATLLAVSCLSDERYSDSGVRFKPREVNVTPSVLTSPSSPSAQSDSLDYKSTFRMLFPDVDGNAPIAGYRHQANRSKFSRGVGALVIDNSTTYVRREIGSNGVFVEYDNGYSAGIPNGNSVSFSVGPYASSGAAHSARVLEYFKTAGLPEAQISGTAINTWMSEGGPTVESSESGKRLPLAGAQERRLIGYVTIVQRAVDGVPVGDSFAWAMLNKDEEAIYEQVWWPDLRMSISAEIAAFKDRLAEPGFREQLVKGDGEGRLVVHHATPTGERWYSSVTYDVLLKGDPETHHFDVTGKEVRLAAWDPVADSGK